MALQYPLALNVFADVLRPAPGTTFFLNEPVQHSSTAGGTIYSASNGAAMWEGTLVTQFARGAPARRVRALMDVLRGPGRTFLIRDLTYRGPQLDPTGAIVAYRKLAIADVETGRVKIGPAAGAGQAEGWPPELRLLPGDLIAWTYGSNPVRHALHEVSPAADSYGHAGSGVTEWIDVVPNIRGNPQPGDLVTLYKPSCKAIAVPDSIKGGEARAGGGFEGFNLQWRQTLR